MKYIFLVLFVLSVISLVRGQTTSTIKAIGRVEKDSIIIRVAPTTVDSWKAGLKSGYKIEKYIVFKGNKYLWNKEKSTYQLLPWPLSRWEKMSENNSLAEVAAQAMFGESFELTGDQKNSFIEIYNKSREIESRFGFALFCADMSADVAKASGLYFSDTLINKNEKYFYKIYVNDTTPKKDTAYLYLNTDEFFSLPAIEKVQARFSDRVVHFSWNIKDIKEYYTAYWIERSEDGSHFTRSNSFPVVNLYNDVKNDVVEWNDSLQLNHKKYYFRVVGISPFGTQGPPSTIIEGEGFKSLNASPSLEPAVQEDEGVIILWKFPLDKEPLLNGFEIERSVSPDKNFNRISPLLNYHTRKYIDAKPLPVNYYRVKAIGKNDEVAYSFPILFQPLDSIPPKSPQGLKSKVDSAGIIKLLWVSNSEPDLLGYRVFRSHFKNSEFSQVTKDPALLNEYTDTVNSRTLTKKVYYKIQALDKRFNPSEFSDVVEVRIPDVIPPVPPLIKNFRVELNKVFLEWEASSSEDVSHTQLSWKTSNSNSWNPIKNFNGNADGGYTIEGLPMGLSVIKVEAVDSTGNISIPATLNIMIAIAVAPTPPKDIRAVADRSDKVIRLMWKNVESGTKSIVIYRSQENEPPALFKKIDATQISFSDAEVKMNTTYSYYLKAVSINGTESLLSEKISLKF